MSLAAVIDETVGGRLARPLSKAAIIAFGLGLGACSGSPIAGTAPSVPLENWQTAAEADHPLVGRIWFPARSAYGSWSDLTEVLTEADFVMLGEKHDNPDHHRLQAMLLKALVDSGQRPGLVWEMIAEDRSDALDRYLSSTGATPRGLGSAVGWDETGWPDWAMYRPIADVAMAARLPQSAGDLSRDERRRVAQAGLQGLTAETTAVVIAGAPWSAEDRDNLEQELIDSHCGMLPASVLPRMASVQRARDGALALSVIEGATTDGAVLIAGSGHARKDRGAPLYLRVVEPSQTTAAVAMFEVVADASDPASYLESYGADAFDAVIFTPRLDNADPCERFRKADSQNG